MHYTCCSEGLPEFMSQPISPLTSAVESDNSSSEGDQMDMDEGTGKCVALEIQSFQPWQCTWCVWEYWVLPATLTAALLLVPR